MIEQTVSRRAPHPFTRELINYMQLPATTTERCDPFAAANEAADRVMAKVEKLRRTSPKSR